MGEPALRIGLVCNTARFTRWQARCVRELTKVPGVEIAVVLDTDGTPGTEPISFLHRWWLRRSRHMPALATEDASTLLSGIPRASLPGKLSGAGHPACDIILQLVATELGPSVQAMPRFGVWRLLHGEEPARADGMPGLWEAIHGDALTVAILRRETAGGTGADILRKGYFRTDARSIDRTIEAVLMCTADWPAQACRAFLGGDPGACAGNPISQGITAKTPSGPEMLGLFWKQFRNGRQFRLASRTGQEEWNIGVLPRPLASLLEAEPSLNLRWLPAPGDGNYRSSPFGYMSGERLNVLYERFHRKTGNGVIARLRPKQDNNLKRSRTLLESDGHLAHPYVVESEGAVYVLPEQVFRGRTDLYVLDGEEINLSPVRTLVEEALFSPTLFQHEGRWWLFATKAPLEDTLLHAYYADSLEGPFIPHALNPIKVDVRSARPGGTPFRAGGELWRPARDCSVEGHGRIALNRVTVLSPTRFSEETVKFVEPLMGAWSHGLRTLSAVGNVTLVDGLRNPSRKPGRQTELKVKVRREPPTEQHG